MTGEQHMEEYAASDRVEQMTHMRIDHDWTVIGDEYDHELIGMHEAAHRLEGGS